MSTQERPSGQAPQWPFDAPPAHGLPDPSAVHTAADLRSAVAEMLRHHDLGVVSAVMRVPLSEVRQVSRWPEQVDLDTFRCFLRACGASLDEERAWVMVWLRLGGANLGGTSLSGIDPSRSKPTGALPSGSRPEPDGSAQPGSHASHHRRSRLEITVPAAVALALASLALLAALLLWLA